MSSAFLTTHQVTSMKARLWAGETHAVLALHFGCSQPLIKKIAQGQRWPEVEWPDGSTGALKLTRRRQIMQARAVARQEATKAMSRTMAAKVRAILGYHE